jgi:hypothetical protein
MEWDGIHDFAFSAAQCVQQSNIREQAISGDSLNLQSTHESKSGSTIATHTRDMANAIFVLYTNLPSPVTVDPPPRNKLQSRARLTFESKAGSDLVAGLVELLGVKRGADAKSEAGVDLGVVGERDNAPVVQLGL